MEWIDTLFVEHTALQAVVVVALICAAGMALGKVRIGGIWLGVTGRTAEWKQLWGILLRFLPKGKKAA